MRAGRVKKGRESRGAFPAFFSFWFLAFSMRAADSRPCEQNAWLARTGAAAAAPARMAFRRSKALKPVQRRGVSKEGLTQLKREKQPHAYDTFKKHGRSLG